MGAKIGLGIAVGSDVIRILKGLRGPTGMIQVLDAVTIPSPLREDTNPDVLHYDAKKILKERKISGTGLIGITGRELILRYVQVPQVSEQRLRAMLAYEIAEISEKIGGDLASEFRILDTSSLRTFREEQLALVALTKNPFLESLFHKIQRLRLAPSGATPNSIALFRSFVRHGTFDSNETLLLVDVGKNNTDICLCQQSKLLFARNLSYGASLLTQAIQEQLGLPETEAERLKIQESSLLPGSTENKVNEAIRYGAGQLLSSLKSSISFAKQQLKNPNLKVDRICLSGGGGQQKGLPEYLSKGLGIPVVRYDPAVELDLSLCSEAGKSLITSTPLEWATPLGILEATTDDQGFSLKLLPTIYEKRAQFLEGPFFLYLTVLFTLSYITVHYLATQRHYEILTRQKQQLLSQRNLLEELKENFKVSRENTRQYEGKLTLFQEAILPGTHFFKVVTKLNAKIPSNIWIKSVSIKTDPQTQKKVIEMDGVIEESDKDVIGELLDFTKLIEEDPSIQQCEPIKRERDPQYGRLLFTCWLRFKNI